MEILQPEELHKLVHDISIAFFHKPFVDDVRFNNRLRTTGGRYLPAERVIELNPKYYREMNRDEFAGIIKHELCHYHLHIAGEGYRHGDKAFKDLMRLTGSPRYCTPLPSEANRPRLTYQCQTCHHVYYRRRRVNVDKFFCGKCRGRLSLLNG